MAALDYVTKSEDYLVTPRTIDFVTRFGRDWTALRNIMGISRPIRKANGTVLKSKKATITLESGNVAEGDLIPFSKAHVEETIYDSITIEKYARAVTLESIAEHGYDVAVQMVDDEFIASLELGVMDKFYEYLRSGELTNIQDDFQAALAMAKGILINKWKNMNKTMTEVVGFANVMDVYNYLAEAPVATVRSDFGFQYIQDFMGYRVVFLCSDNQIPRGKFIAVPKDNIVNYYIDPSDSEFARAGLVYATDNITNLIGFGVEGNRSRAESEGYAIIGLRLFAEYIDGIAVVSFGGTGSLGSVTVASAAGAAAGDSKVTITYSAGAGEKLYYIDSANAITYEYGDEIDLSDYTEIVPQAGGNNISGLTSGHKVNVVAVNGTNQVVASGNATVVVKS